MSSDHELMRQIQLKNAAALGQLYDRHGSRVYSLAMAVLHDPASAQEVAQDIFLKIWSHPERYAFDDNRFTGWLLTMTRNCAIDRLRRDKRQVESAFSLDLETSPQLADAQQIDDLRWEEMNASMHALSAEQRAVIVLTYYHGLSQSEIAAHLNWPLGTVKTRYRLGMQKLRGEILSPAE